MLILGFKALSGFLSGLNFTTQTTETNKTALHAISKRSPRESHWLIHVFQSLRDNNRFITLFYESKTPSLPLPFLPSFLPSFLPFFLSLQFAQSAPPLRDSQHWMLFPVRVRHVQSRSSNLQKPKCYTFYNIRYTKINSTHLPSHNFVLSFPDLCKDIYIFQKVGNSFCH